MARLKPIIQRDTSQETEDLTFRKVGRLKVSFAEAILIECIRSERPLSAQLSRIHERRAFLPIGHLTDQFSAHTCVE